MKLKSIMVCTLNIVPYMETTSIHIISLFFSTLLFSLGFENTVCFACRVNFMLAWTYFKGLIIRAGTK